jgi:hypothetical protein
MLLPLANNTLFRITTKLLNGLGPKQILLNTYVYDGTKGRVELKVHQCLLIFAEETPIKASVKLLVPIREVCCCRRPVCI